MLSRNCLPILLCSAVVLFSIPSHAQTRVAYIDATKLLKRMPEAIDAQTRLDQLTSTWSKEASDMQNELDRKQAEFDRRKLIMTDAERSAAEVELQNMRKKVDDFRHQKFDENGGELFTQEASLMKTAYERLENAIKDAALDGNYDYVFDCSSKDIVLLYKNSKYDLTINVARRLGIESDILTTPLVNNGPKGGGTTGRPSGQNHGEPGTLQKPPGNPQPPPFNPGPNPGISPTPNPQNPIQPGGHK